MATSKTGSKPKRTSADTTEAVDEFMATLEHPHKAGIEALRKITCDAHSSIAEGVKWNAPSFRTGEYFATVNLRAKDGIAVILHLGAKVREHPKIDIKDSTGLLKWLAFESTKLRFRTSCASGSNMSDHAALRQSAQTSANP
jgi:hypothetical protein